MNNMEPGKYRARKSIVPLKNDSSSPLNEQLKREVESIICVIADKRSIPVLIDLLDDKEFDVRWIAAESLIRIGRKSIVPLLRTIRDGRNFSFPGKALHVLQSLLTHSERKALQPLLNALMGNKKGYCKADSEASEALIRVFRYMN